MRGEVGRDSDCCCCCDDAAEAAAAVGAVTADDDDDEDAPNFLDGDRFGKPEGNVKEAVLEGFSGGGDGGHGVDEDDKEVVLTGDWGGW